MSIHTQIKPDLDRKAAELAAKSGVNAQQIIDGILRNGLEDWEREYALIQKSIDEAKRGEFASDDDIERVRNKYRPGA